jgi:hypothetical protein
MDVDDPTRRSEGDPERPDDGESGRVQSEVNVPLELAQSASWT